MNFTMREFMADRLRAYTLLARLDRPVGIYLLLWPTLWSLWLAGNGQPSQTVFVVFVLGVVLMRSAGCVINDYADRDLDTQVERTRDRPLAKGWVTPTEALALAGILLILAFLCVLLTNWLTILMSFVALALAATYPLMKRVHHLPQVHLGLAFGWAIPMAWVAQTGEFPATTAWLLYLANVCWSVAYDTMYALADPRRRYTGRGQIQRDPVRVLEPHPDRSVSDSDAAAAGHRRLEVRCRRMVLHRRGCCHDTGYLSAMADPASRPGKMSARLFK